MVKFSILKIAIIAIFGISVYSQGYSGGSGTEEKPYILKTAEDINSLANNPTHWDDNFVLAADINMAGINFNGIADGSPAFSGSFDGQGFVISNLAIYEPNENNIGFFGSANGAEIRNLGLRDVNMVGRDYVGGLIGQVIDGQIENCYVQGYVSGNSYIGLLVGYLQETTSSVEDCYVDGTVRGSNYVGGFVGQNYRGFITKSYAIADVNTGGIFIGLNFQANTSDCYCANSNPNTNFPAINSGVLTGVELVPDVNMTDSDTFAGWDLEATWRMCDNGVDYPRLKWEYSKLGDFRCPDGVGFEDFTVLADFWLTDSYDADLDKDGVVNYNDLSIFTQNWLIID